MTWVCEEHPDQPWPHDDCDGAGMPSRRSTGSWQVAMTREGDQYPTYFNVPFEDAATEREAEEIARAEMPESFSVERTTALK